MRDVMIERAVTLDRPLDETWSLVTDPVLLGHWMGGTFHGLDAPASPGARFTFHSADRAQRGEIGDVVPRRLITWTWSDGAEESIVRIEISGDDETTNVRVSERLLPPREWSRPSIPPIEASVA